MTAKVEARDRRELSPDIPPSFDKSAADSAIARIQTLLDAMEIIHGTFVEQDDQAGFRRASGALEPVLEMTVAETAKLRTILFGPGG